MILAEHNAHLTEVQAPGTVADPSLDCTAGSGSGSTARWTGDCQASLRDIYTEEVRAGARIVVRQVLVSLPSNLPVMVNETDLLTFNTWQGETVTLEVRGIDKTFWGLGQFRYTCRYY